MIHVGNDIVDLASPFTFEKSRDSKFVNRVLTQKEQAVIDQSAQNADRLLWAHWAAKESAFKVVSKIQSNVSSSPRKYDVSFIANTQSYQLQGMVNTPVECVYCLVHFYKTCGKEWIHCIGSSKPLGSGSEIVYRAAKIDHLFDCHFSRASEKQSRHVRKMAGKKIAEFFSEQPENISFQKNIHQGEQPYPEVYIYKKKTNIDVSFSHDGRFVAYAFCLNGCPYNT
ncbi:MAG: 4'-phosphopantetheinyl transferase superfamily protein [Candidatus Magnetomorum sp.]|nr:4'-phosphopantetheinyl transferase superfamily protein [Candidatus Magnetomorum sp.]